MNKKTCILLILCLSFILGESKVSFSGNIGILSPINSKTRSDYSVGYATGLMIKFPKKIKILNHDFMISSEVNTNILDGNNIKDINMISGLVHLETLFSKSPFGIRFGTGIADHPYSGIVGLTNLDFLHQLTITLTI